MSDKDLSKFNANLQVIPNEKLASQSRCAIKCKIKTLHLESMNSSNLGQMSK